MKRLLSSILLAGMVLAGCGESTKSKEPKNSYFIDQAAAASVTRLAMRTAALVGRHAAYPRGMNSDPAALPTCPSTKATGKIKITPTCLPDFTTPGAVDCTIAEVFSCPEVAGAITNSVAMRADQLSFSLNAAEYKEGMANLGFIKYNGKVDALTKPSGSTSYQENLSVVARAAGDTEDTVVTSTSDVTVTTSAAKLQFDGSASLVITGMGTGKVNMIGLDFGDCKISPKSGSLDLVLEGVDHAVVEFSGCGQATLYHYSGISKVDPETLGDDRLMSMFGTSITDLTNFRAVTANTEPSATALSPGRWCVPVSATTPNLSNHLPGAQGGAVPILFDAAATLATVQKPMLECLDVAPNATLGMDVATHLILTDETGLGLFADKSQVTVNYAAMATLTTATGGVAHLGYFKLYKGEYGITQAAFETAMGVYLAGGADPMATVGDPFDTTSAHGGTAMKNFQYSFDHFGVRLIAPVPDVYWLVRFY